MMLSSPQSDNPKEGTSSIELYSKGYMGSNEEEGGARGQGDFSTTCSGERGCERRGEERGEEEGEVCFEPWGEVLGEG